MKHHIKERCPLCDGTLENNRCSGRVQCLTRNCRFHTPSLFLDEIKNMVDQRERAERELTHAKLRIKTIIEFTGTNLFKDGAPLWKEPDYGARAYNWPKGRE